MVTPLVIGSFLWHPELSCATLPNVGFMQLSINGKQLNIGSALRQHIEHQVSTIVGKYFLNPTDANVTVSKEGPSFRTDTTVHVGKGIIVQGHSLSGDPYASFDEAASHVAKRLRRYKRRLRDHHRGHEGDDHFQPAAQYVLAAEEESETDGADESEPMQPIVVAEMETGIETLTVGEAVMRMDLANLPAMMFRNRGHGGLNMVYVRGDGNIGWIDPQDRES